MRTTILCLAIAMGFAMPGRASAASCGTVTGTTASDTIVLGPAVVYYGQIGWVPTGALYGCVDNGVTRVAQDSGCDGDEGPATWVTVNAGLGNDIVAPHTGGVINCGGVYIGPWPEYGTNEYTIGVEINGGSGGDIIHGSRGPDRLHSNNFSGTNDSAQDVICGYGGADALRGDTTDAGDLECLNGGNGGPPWSSDADTCDGMGADTASDPDLVFECETWASAVWSWDFNDPWCMNYCGASPPVLL